MIEAEYEALMKPLDELGSGVQRLLVWLCEKHRLVFQSVDYRVKDLPSLRVKLSEQGAEPRLGEVHDLLGVRVVTYFPDAVDRVGDIVASTFIVDEANSTDKRKLLEPDRFGYLSLHYVVSLDASQPQVLAAEAVAGRKFEIQIRSLVQHAWAEIEHDLGYKSPTAIPREIRRRFSRLAGLLEVADDEFCCLRDDIGKRRSKIGASVADGTAPVHGDSVAVLIDQDREIKLFDEDLWVRSGLRGHLKPSYAPSKLAEELLVLDVTNVGALRSAWEARRQLMPAFLEEWRRRDELFNEAPTTLSLFCLVFILIAERGAAEGEWLLERLDIAEAADRKRLAYVLEAVHLAVSASKPPST